MTSAQPNKTDAEREFDIIRRLHECDSCIALHALIDLLNPHESAQYGGIGRRGVAAILSVFLRAVEEDLRVAMEAETS
jgi:hypothetical protein